MDEMDEVEKPEMHECRSGNFIYQFGDRIKSKGIEYLTVRM
jgi:hypothetical protein